ncbi:TetR/AcrR family transcriptional regulator [Aquimarina hainanensis]|uniref:TetR/AcrR family transcriptional regulator n=2 Tax=Flavobacteriaceae TaxID=49546 RepID=A0ABW5N9T8_9FLAO
MTKVRILAHSLQLFNTYGIGAVSQRKIADTLAISPGNLTYHFKKKEDIEIALYEQLVDKVSVVIEGALDKRFELSSMFEMTKGILSLFFEYRFIFLDFVQLMRGNQKIATHYSALMKQRKEQFFYAIHQLENNGLIREEELPDEYEFLYDRFQILSDFWIASAEFSTGNVTAKNLKRYTQVILQSIYPYLTTRGKTEFLNCLKS